MFGKESSLFSVYISFFFVLWNRFLLFTLSLTLPLHFNHFLLFYLRLHSLFRWPFRGVKFLLISAEFRRTLDVALLTIIDRQGLDSIGQRDNFLNFDNLFDAVDMGNLASFIRPFPGFLFVGSVVAVGKVQDRNGDAIFAN